MRASQLFWETHTKMEYYFIICAACGKFFRVILVFCVSGKQNHCHSESDDWLENDRWMTLLLTLTQETVKNSQNPKNLQKILIKTLKNYCSFYKHKLFSKIQNGAGI
jgi:hypothetical protein